MNKRISMGNEYDALYEKWRYTVMRAFVYGWALVTLVELAMGVALDKAGYGAFDLAWVLKYCANPAIANFIIIVITFICIGSKRMPSHFKNWIIIIMIAADAFVLCGVHSFFAGIYMIFIAPVLASAIFGDKKLTVMTGFVCVIFLILSYFFGSVYEEHFDYFNHLINAAVAVFVLALSTMISFIMVCIYQEREVVLSEITEANVKLTKEVKYDGLTGILNHTSFYAELDKAIERLRETGKVFCVTMIDIDNFKRVNDNCGHNIGDNILRSVATILTDTMGTEGIVFRYGGDEFAVILADHNIENAKLLVDKARRAISVERYDYLPDDVVVRISAGIYEAKEANINAEQAFYRADQALYEAKFNGKDQIALGHSEM